MAQEPSTPTSTGVVIKGSVFGGGNAAEVKVNTIVRIETGMVEGNVYGGGNEGDVGNLSTTDKTNYTWINQDGGTNTNTAHNNTLPVASNKNTGVCTVTITGGTIGIDGTLSPDHGNVFGAGKGATSSFYCEKAMAYATNVSISKGKVYGNVYGGGQVGRVEDDTKVTIDATSEDDLEIKGSVFGAGAGVATHGYSALVRGNSDVTIQGKAQVAGSVYGGGEIASVGRFKVVNSLPKEPLSGGTCKVTIQGEAQIGTGGTGDVYGACKGVTPDYAHNGGHVTNTSTTPISFTSETEYLSFLKTLALTSTTNVTIDGTASVTGSVFGGGQRGITLGSVDVSVSGGSVATDVYGGGALADTNTSNWNEGYGGVAGLIANETSVSGYYELTGDGSNEHPYEYVVTSDTKADGAKTYYSKDTWAHVTQNSAWHKTTVSLTGGIIGGDVYGGGLGDLATLGNGHSEVAALVYGDVKVDLNKTSGTCEIKGNLFGCNNLNGSPMGNVEVNVDGTNAYDTSSTTPTLKAKPTKFTDYMTVSDADLEAHSFELLGVFGGGDLATYSPKSGKSTVVNINGCTTTSIKEVYGGGNSADVPSCSVNVDGAYEIGYVYGGGNGTTTTAANVGRQNDATYGTGNATTTIRGGTIYRTFGGSNTNGNIFGTPTLDIADASTSVACQQAFLGEVFSYGNKATISTAATVTLGCLHNKVGSLYGGAMNADVDNDITLNIKGGTYGSVFGGNKTGGSINGSITVNIEEDASCSINIDELYGCGNEAPYSIWGTEQDSDDNWVVKTSGTTGTDKNDPQVNIYSFTSIGSVFGGGKGSSAVVFGEPAVNINIVKANTGYTLNNVYGGGNQAEVQGKTQVNIGTLSQVNLPSADDETTMTSVKGAKITNCVYGGGNEANVDGDTEVNIGTVTFTGDDIDGVLIVEDVFGGGKGSTTNVTGTSTVNIGTEPTTGTYVGNSTVTGNVYGGSAFGTVNNAVVELFNNTSVSKIFGGGMGYTDASTPANNKTAQVTTSAAVTMHAGTVQELYGGCNERGVIDGTVQLDLKGGTVGTAYTSGPISDVVFGGGLGENTYVKQGVTVNIGTSGASSGATINGNVYGGGAKGHVNAEEVENATTHVKAPASTTTTAGKLYATTVNLYSGTIYGDVYGGGLGKLESSVEKPAFVGGNVTVNLNGAALNVASGTYTVGTETKSYQTGRIFGCNNAFGSPQGHVLVHVFKTNKSTDTSDSYEYDLATVYGGGNEADYVPGTVTDAPNAEVIIEGCTNTKIENVYGGGNAAAVPGTEVWILGANIIDNVFGGGNGELGAEYAAHVGFHRISATSKNNYNVGDGKTYVKLVGGTINTVYGGSNSNGDVRSGSNISMPSESAYSESHPGATAVCCPNLVATNIYGGGRNADMSSGTSIILGCMPNDWIKDVYAGSRQADVAGNVSLTITSGKFARVFGGNETSGIIKGSITVNIEETKEKSCGAPIIIGELYGGGNEAGYSIYGYNDDTTPRTKAQYDVLKAQIAGKTEAQIAASDELSAVAAKLAGLPYDNPQLNVRAFTSIGAIYGGGYSAFMAADPTVSINVVKGSQFNEDAIAAGSTPANMSSLSYPAHPKGSIGIIGNVFGGGNLAEVDGSATVNIGTETEIEFSSEVSHLTAITGTGTGTSNPKKYAVEGAYITGNVYGGGNEADVTGSTQVNICAKKNGSDVYESVDEGTSKVIIDGNVFGAGKGVASDITKAKVLTNSNVYMGGGWVKTNVYGGGHLGSVGTFTYTVNTETGSKEYTWTLGGVSNVTIFGGTVGPDGTEIISDKGNVFGAGKGSDAKFECEPAMVYQSNVVINNGTVKGTVYGGGEIGRVDNNTTVTIGIQGEETSSPDIKGSVFGAGKGEDTHGYSALVRGNSTVTVQGNAKVGHSVYGGGEIATVGRYIIEDGLPTTPVSGGFCTVTVRDNAEIGPDNMRMVTASGYPDDTGYIFGGGKGVLPRAGIQRMNENDQLDTYNNAADYTKYVMTLALASNTDVTVDGNAFVKGSVYGGSENGYVQADTHVTIAGGQIGCGKNTTKRHKDEYPGVWDADYVPSDAVDLECDHWTYGAPYAPYDIYKDANNDGKPDAATDGHTFYGNVFGGGSGYFPYAEGPALTSEQIALGYSKGVWHRPAGSVGGNTVVDITGGHILTSVYGGNEQTDVTGSCTINMTGGTVGVPRTLAQMQAHPVTCYVFGAGKGDQRVNFNTWTNVASTQVNISGTARIYGSTFGGGEDGHVLGDAETNIGGDAIIGTTGTSGVDGNIFGGGRGFSETALTAGVVGGDVRVNISNGKILGTVFGGGRLASVGTYFADAGSGNYGKMQDDVTTPATYYTTEDAEVVAGTKQVGDVKVPASTSTHGHITITIEGGTIGATDTDGKLTTSTFSIGDVFGGCKGSSNNDLRFGLAKTTTITMSGGKVKGSVYGGGEVAVVEGNTTISISGGEVGDGVTKKGGAKIGNVYGGGKGNLDVADAGLVKGNTSVTIDQASGKTTNIYHNIYGGGAYGSVGTITRAAAGATYVPGRTGAVLNMPTSWERKNGDTGTNTGTAEVYVYGGQIGTDGDENGMVFGSSRGDVSVPTGATADAPYGTDVDKNDRLAWVYDTKVVIGKSGSSPDIRGSVYGSGENGHVFTDTNVQIQNGKIGVDGDTDTYGTAEITDLATNITYTGANYPKRGNVYGGGCGEDDYTVGGTKYFNPLAGIVLGNTDVTVSGGKVVHNVYGAGALGSVGSGTLGGKTTIEVSDGQVGDDGVGDGNVYGAARGKSGITQTNIAQVRETSVTISSTGNVRGSVFGGGEAGIVKQDVKVSMTGGTVGHDVYGGGALADTQTGNWDTSTNTWAEGKIDTDGKTAYKTIVNLMGGLIMGDAYGGGLGDLSSRGTGHSDVAAQVYGDVFVTLGNATEDVTAATATTFRTTYATDDKGLDVVNSGRVFGCNNFNGSPMGNVTVTVNRTVTGKDAAGNNLVRTVLTRDAQNKVTNAATPHVYEVAAVYGGGNLANYEPVAGKKPMVRLNTCDISIEEVYGGGNAAMVPETDVLILGAHEIENVFGGGNGEDKYTLNGTDWITNPGANVGTSTNPGNTNTLINGGYIHEAYGASNSKGTIFGDVMIDTGTTDAAHAACPVQVEKLVAAGKDADVNGDLKVILGCKDAIKIPIVYGGADNANVNGNVELTITSGHFGQVFGGNNLGGAIRGHIILNIEETSDCEPIRIDELYLGGNQASYSKFGYYIKTTTSEGENAAGKGAPDETPELKNDKLVFMPRKSKDDPHYPVDTYNHETKEWTVITDKNNYPEYADPVMNLISCTEATEVFGGGFGEGGDMYANPTVNINMIPGKHAEIIKRNGTANPHDLGTIGDVYGGGNQAAVVGNATINIGSANEVTVNSMTYDPTTKVYTSGTATVEGAYITGNVYGGGKLADVTSNTYVNVCAKEADDASTADVIEYKGVTISGTGYEGVIIAGNVFGGGKGIADSFTCAKAMIGVDKENDGKTDITKESTNKGTRVSIGNGTVNGTVYGGGEIGRVEWNTVVTIGLPVESGTSAPVIRGDVFGAGKGVEPYGYAALVRGNTFVTVQADAKVGHSIYGGGEIASVGKYTIASAEYAASHPEIEEGMPYSLANQGSGYCNVIVRGNAEIGPDGMVMNNTTTGKPDDLGHVFGAGKGVLPYENLATTECQTHAGKHHPGRMAPGNVWECYEGNEAKYLSFVETQALATQTDVTIDGNAFVKGSVYGGSENGHVQHDTHVTIEGECQIGAGYDTSTKKSLPKYTGWPTKTEDITTSWAECAHWEYDASSAAPYDLYAKYKKTIDGKDKYYYDEACTYYAEGGSNIGKDGHTYYGNVFGGGSGVIPYAPGKWHRAAGSVGGNTQVDITGGHILTSVYGGNEQTDVGTYTKDDNGALVVPVRGGKCTINMTGGTLGVPRTAADAKLHPVTCYLFGAGKGDQRIFFNTWTNVIETEVNIGGNACIYGSTFGGGEDGHVIKDAVTNISGSAIIGTTGTSYVDGNVFGGGRGFSGDAQTAGTVGGNIEVNISGGTMLGNVYGGGRLASVGTQFTSPTDPNYGNFIEDEKGSDAKTYGHVTVNISGGTIGNNGTDRNVIGDVSGNVFGGSMGRLTLLNGETNPIWPKMAQVKATKVIVSGGTIKHNVYGGGELGTVRDDAVVTISGGQVNRDVYGAGYGSDQLTPRTTIEVKEPKPGVTNPTSAADYNVNYYTFTPMLWAGCVGKSTTVNINGGLVRKSVYGGGEMASVGIIDSSSDKDGNLTHSVTHTDEKDGFALSWPYEFKYTPGYEGATHVNVTGGRIGVTKNDDDINTDNGDVHGGGKGIAGDYKDYVYCANVGSSEVTINYTSSAATEDPTKYLDGGDCITGAVYGGAENGHVMGDTKLTLVKGLVGHSIYGGGSGKGQFTKTLDKITGVEVVTNNTPTPAATQPTQTANQYDATIYSVTAGKVFGNSTVEMSGGYVVRNVYGGGNLGSVGKGNYAGGADDYSTAGYGEKLTGNLWDGVSDESKAFLNSGKSTVTITGGTVGYIDFTKVSDYTYSGLPYGNVFGGCRGESAPNIGESPRYLYCPTFFSGYANETEVTIGNAGGTGPTIWGSVYGGGMDGHVRRDAKVTINGGEIGRPYTGDGSAADLAKVEWSQCGNVYGAGSGIGQYKYDFNYDGDYEDVVKYTNPQNNRTTEVKERDFSTSAGSVTRFTTVIVNGGKIHRNVYGGGSLSSIGGPKIPPITYDPYRKGDTTTGHGAGKQSQNEVTIAGGTIGDEAGFTKGYGGCVFGASRGDETLANPTSFASSVWTDVNIQGGTIVGEVYGGGEAGTVRQSTDVQLTGGMIVRDAFAGGKGTSKVAADVGGDATIELNKQVADDAANVAKMGAVVKGNVFGANNVNGTPKGHVLVHVYGTQNEKTTAINAKVDDEYDVTGVYGGGKSSDYVPDANDTKQSTEVIIEGCDLTSIYEVYGGGYGAATPATDVLIKGTKIIENVFGGGYGASTAGFTNPGANIGYHTDKSKYDLGTGKALVRLMAGTIKNVYGASNTLGDIRGGSNVTNVANDGSAGCCDKLTVGEIYGGGKQADMFGGAEIILGCMPNDWIGAIYAGAENANVGGDVGLTLTSGKFERVFGGNKSGGVIDGYIEVNIEENPECGTPIIIGELYGGGNEAAYTIPEKYGANYLSPRVNVRAFTSIGTIFGGGLGKTATVTGNPWVNINEVAGGREYAGETRTLEDGTKVTLYERKADGKMGVIGTVFGGGNAAPVIGNPRVEIGTAAKQKMLSLQTKDADGKVIEVEKDVLGADIRGNVYGGGNNAAVTGDPKVVIGQEK